MNNITIQFENYIKQYKALFFNKIWEKFNNGFKLIYNIQGLNYNNNFYPNLKFIFWFDVTKQKITENVITYLYTSPCVYKTISINEEMPKIIERVLNSIKSVKSNKDLMTFIISGTDKFNEILKKSEIDVFISNISYIPFGNCSCDEYEYKFNIDSNTDSFLIRIRFDGEKYIIRYNDIEEVVNTVGEIYKKIIIMIYAIK